MNAGSVAPDAVGSDMPTYRSVPDYVETMGPDVGELSAMAGLPPDPAQQAILDALFAYIPDPKSRRGYRSVAFETAMVVGRQNLKTALCMQAALGWLFYTDERLIIWSAHEWPNVQEAFRGMDELIGGCPALAKRVKRFHRSNGDEAIELTGDRRLKFRTRTKGGGRGLTGDKIILDEGFALQPGHMGALVPTLSARDDPQLLYGSSAGRPESEVLRGVRDRGRAGNDPALAYFEWCAPDPEETCERGKTCTHELNVPGCGCDNEEYWLQANPAVGRRITLDYIRKERRALPPHEFGRERMGWWDEAKEGQSAITVEQFMNCFDPNSLPIDPVAFAVDVRPDRSAASIAVAGRRSDGLGHASVVANELGTGWVIDRIMQLVDKWKPVAVVIDPASPAGSMEQDLLERGFVVEKDPEIPTERRLCLVSSREYAQACGAFVDATLNKEWRHRGQQELKDAVEGARTRPLADAYAWSRVNSEVDITPLVAVTLARHGFAEFGLTAPVAPIAIWGDR